MFKKLKLSTVIAYILAFLIFVGAVGALVVLFSDNEEDTYTEAGDLYISYNGEEYTADSNIPIEAGTESIQLFVNSVKDRGAYNVTDCVVKMVAYTDNGNSFSYSADGTEYVYGSSVLDLTAAFVEDYTAYSGNGFEVTEDGCFTVYFSITKTNGNAYMTEVLSRVYDGKTIAIDGDIDMTYCYFAIEITSPDGLQTITVPIVIELSQGITLTTDSIYF